ncbi:MAG: alpha/beta fold hydrolase, partial [Enterobacteriaceae bacterium]
MKTFYLRRNQGDEPLLYYDCGQGEAVLLLHGILADHRIWQPHCRLLSDRYRCLAYTQRYFGTGAPLPQQSAPFGCETHLQDLLTFCDQLQLDRVALVGWSYSAHIALLAALTDPQRFSQVLLYDLIVPTYGLTERERCLFAQDMRRMMRPVLQALKVGDSSAAVACFRGGCLPAGVSDATDPQ